MSNPIFDFETLKALAQEFVNNQDNDFTEAEGKALDDFLEYIFESWEDAIREKNELDQ